MFKRGGHGRERRSSDGSERQPTTSNLRPGMDKVETAATILPPSPRTQSGVVGWVFPRPWKYRIDDQCHLATGGRARGWGGGGGGGGSLDPTRPGDVHKDARGGGVGGGGGRKLAQAPSIPQPVPLVRRRADCTSRLVSRHVPILSPLTGIGQDGWEEATRRRSNTLSVPADLAGLCAIRRMAATPAAGHALDRSSLYFNQTVPQATLQLWGRQRTRGSGNPGGNND